MKHPQSREHPSQHIDVADRVTFTYRQREYVGYVQKKGRTYAYVVCDDSSECKVPYPLLSKIPHAPKQRVQSRSEKLRLQFQVNDRIAFTFRQQTRQGIITRLNPKRAHVVCENDQEFHVPYENLVRCQTPHAPQEEYHTEQHGDRLHKVAVQAQSLIREHGLTQWSFQFDHGTRRAGSCQYSQCVITMPYEYARHASDSDIRDTLLHEIAHALVGKQHNHDAIWRAKAAEIGCSGSRCHDIQFTLPRYIMKCVNGCWTATAERRRRNIVCKRCHGKIVYITYTSERWKREQTACLSSESTPQK